MRHSQFLIFIILVALTHIAVAVWQIAYTSSGATNVDWVSAAWLSSQVVFMVGKTATTGAIIQSVTAGTSWTTSLTGSDPFYDIISETISGTVYVVAVCSNGAIYFSSNSVANIANSYSWSKVATVSGSLYGVSIGGTGYIVAVGYQSSQPSTSLVYKSNVNTPNTWTLAAPGLTVQLNAVDTADGSNFLIVGDLGTILYFQYVTTSFTRQTSPVTSELYDISVFNSNLAVVCGSSATVLTTKTFGATWSYVNVAGIGQVTSTTNFYYHPISMMNAQDVYLASSSGDILISQNAGTSWTAAVTPPLPYQLYSLAAYSIQLVVTGTARSSVTSPATSAVYVKGPGTNDFTFLPTGQPTSVPTGRLQQNTMWEIFKLNSPSYFIRSSVWSTSSNVVLVGSNVANDGIILHSKNAGMSFTLIPSTQYKTQGQSIPAFTSVATGLYTINKVNQYYHLAVASSGAVVVSTNNGFNWTLAVNLAASLYGVTLGRNGYAYTAGQYSDGTSAVFVTSAAFDYYSWSDISPFKFGLNLHTQLNAIRTFDGKRLIAVGMKGLIITCPSGIISSPSWYVRQNGTNYDLYSISGATSKIAIVGGTNLAMLQTSNAGVNWTQTSSIFNLGLPSSSGFMYTSIYMATSAVIYAATSNGAILQSVTGGLSWANATTLAYGVSKLTSLSFYQTVAGIAVSDDGFTYVQVHEAPSGQPTRQPSRQPTSQPSRHPSRQPTAQPSSRPTIIPFTVIPSSFPSGAPVVPPSSQPSAQPSSSPTSFPTAYYDVIVEVNVLQSFINVNTHFLNTSTAKEAFTEAILSFFSVQNRWIRVLLGNVTSYFQNAPTSMPSGHPSARPTAAVERHAPHFPTSQPTSRPTRQPTGQPSRHPSSQPTTQPIRHPLARPTSVPTSQPSQTLRRKLSENSNYETAFIKINKFDVQVNSAAGVSGASVNYAVAIAVPASGFKNISSAYNYIFNSLTYAVQSSVCTTSMKKAFSGTSADGIVCQPFISIGNAIVIPIHTSPTPSQAPSIEGYIGSLSRASFIVLMVFMGLIFLCCVGGIAYFVLPMCGIESFDDICSCCGKICACFCCCFRRRGDDDDYDDNRGRNNRSQELPKSNSRWNKNKRDEEEEEEEEDDDDDDDHGKKKGWFSKLFGRKKGGDDDDDDEEEEDDDDEDDDKWNKNKNSSRFETVRTSGARSR